MEYKRYMLWSNLSKHIYLQVQLYPQLYVKNMQMNITQYVYIIAYKRYDNNKTQ